MEPGIYSAVGTNAGESDLNLPADNPKCFLMYTWLITTITINSEQELKLKLIKNKPNKLWANCEARTVERELRSANCGTWAAERESTGTKASLKKCSQICIRNNKKSSINEKNSQIEENNKFETICVSIKWNYLCFGWLSSDTMEGPPSSVNTTSIKKIETICVSINFSLNKGKKEEKIKLLVLG